MNEILRLEIINPEELCEKAYLSVDIFETFAKVLTLVDGRNRYGSTLAASFEIMKRLANTPKDIGGILTKLETFTLGIADECFHKLGQSPTKVKEMAPLTPRQDLAMEVTKTFKGYRIKEITKLNWVLARKLKTHEKSLLKLIDSQEKLAIVNNGIYDNMDSLETVTSQLKEATQPLLSLIQRLFGLKAKRKILEIDHTKNDKIFRKYLDKVRAAEDAMTQVSNDVMHFTRKCLKRRFINGVTHLQRVLANIVPKERQQPFKDILATIVPDEETDNLIATASKTYEYPDVTVCLCATEDILPYSTFKYPEKYLSTRLKEERPIRGLAQRLPIDAQVITMPMKTKSLLNVPRVVEYHKTSVSDTRLAFGWSPLRHGSKSFIKKWRFFRVP